MTKPQHPMRAIVFMLISMFLFAAMSALIRGLSETMHSTQIVFLRNAFSMGIILAWTFALQRRALRFPTRRLGSHLWRSGVGFVSMSLWFYSLSILPLTVAVAFSFTTPIFATIFAAMFLGEKVGIHRWSAIMAGFVGIWVMLRPDGSAISLSAGIVLLSSALIAWSSILVKSLTRTDSPETIIFYMTLFMLILSVPPALYSWQPFTLYQALLAFLIALASVGAHLLLTRAVATTDMVVLMPFDFTRLIFASIFAYIFFGEVLDRYTLTGALIIVASTAYIAWREKKHKTTDVTAPAAPV